MGHRLLARKTVRLTCVQVLASADRRAQRPIRVVAASCPSSPAQPSSVLREHALRALDPLTKAVPEFSITFPPLDVHSDRHADHFRDWPTVDSRDDIQFLGLRG